MAQIQLLNAPQESPREKSDRAQKRLESGGCPHPALPRGSPRRAAAAGNPAAAAAAEVSPVPFPKGGQPSLERCSALIEQAAHSHPPACPPRLFQLRQRLDARPIISPHFGQSQPQTCKSHGMMATGRCGRGGGRNYNSQQAQIFPFSFSKAVR